MRDEAAFTAFVAARGPALLRLGWLLTADADAAQDLAQEALTRLVRHWDRLTAGSQQGNPEAYARATMRSIWIDSWRRRHGWVLEPLATTADDASPVTDPQDASSDRLDLDRALRLLAPRQRAVLVLRFYEDLTEQQTARALRISTSTVKSQARDGLARLRTLAPWLDPACLDPATPDDETDPEREVVR